MKIIICDASPLIFLAKLDLLRLIPEVLEGEVWILRCVVDEVCSESAAPLEMTRLNAFLEGATVVDFDEFGHPSKSLSRSDRATLTWAIANRADWLVADERLLRRIASAEGIAVIGFLGLVIVAAEKGLLPPAAAKAAVDTAVSKLGLRISVGLYRRIVSELDE